MKDTPQKKSPSTEKPVSSKKGEKGSKEPIFTPPAKPEVKAQKGRDKRDEEAAKAGSEFDVVKIEKQPAESTAKRKRVKSAAKE